MNNNQIPGLAIAVLVGGDVIFEKTYGFANVELEVPVSTESVFELASLTKQFSAAAILLLETEGKLSLDDPVTAYLEDTPPAWRDIRIHHLLSHTSGLADRFEETVGDRPIMDHSAEDMIRSAMSTPMIARPGEKWSYSDQGYALLGQIIARTSGLPYDEFVETRLLNPAGIRGAHFHSKQEIIPDRVAGYVFKDGRLENVRRDWQYEIVSHFGIMASISDLVTWEKALVKMEALSTEQLGSAWEPHWQLFEDEDFSMSYGYGWFVADLGNYTVVEHTGVTGTSYVRVLETDTAVIVLSNLAFHDVSALGRRILKLLDPEIPFTTEAL